jgi:hypothetical protein
MGAGTRAAGTLHGEVIDNFKDQLLLAFVKQNGGKWSIPVAEIDATGGYVMNMQVVDGVFHFTVERKS